jgi:3-chloro-4-hydroxyphenylacetate reductive dehalogenase
MAVYPVDSLKRVDQPTTLINEAQIQRIDERRSGFNRAALGEWGAYLQNERHHFIAKEPLSAALTKMDLYLKDFRDGPVSSSKAPLPEDPVSIARHIKEFAYFLRADIVGICELPRYAVYSHDMEGEPIDLDHKYAIAVVIDQDWKTAEATVGNDWISNAMSFLGYSTSGFIASVLADYIRRLGYPARAHHGFFHEVLEPPILVQAGIGEMSRIGDIVVNPFLGPRFKSAIVTTDLPMVTDKPIDFGLQDFCSKCKLCAQHCPGRAISFGDKVLYNGYERWPADAERCTKQRIGNQAGVGCGVCIKVCPWNKPFKPLHRFTRWTIGKTPLFNSLFVRGEKLLRYGMPKPEKKWWLDLETLEDGSFVVPSRAGHWGNNEPEDRQTRNVDEDGE